MSQIADNINTVIRTLPRDRNVGRHVTALSNGFVIRYHDADGLWQIERPIAAGRSETLFATEVVVFPKDEFQLRMALDELEVPPSIGHRPEPTARAKERQETLKREWLLSGETVRTFEKTVKDSGVLRDTADALDAIATARNKLLSIMSETGYDFNFDIARLQEAFEKVQVVDRNLL